MGFFDKLKKWLKPKNEKIRDANRVTNYGGGVKRNDTVSEVKRSIRKAEKAKEKRQETRERQATTRGSAFKATPQSVKKAEAKDKQTSKPTRSNAFKATPPTIRHQSTALGTMSELDAKTRLAKMNAYNENRKYQSRAADKLKPLIEAKYGGDTLESKQRIKSGEWMSDPNVAKYDVLKHPIANSLARGGLSGATLGLSDLAAAKLTKGEAREAEELYQANKNKLAEGIGTFAGAMLPYAGTAKAFENLGVRAVGRAAETQVGKRLGAEALAKAMSGTGAKSVLARSLVGDAIQDSTLGLVDTMAGVAQRDDLETTNDYLKAIAKGQLANYGMGLAGNVVSNVAPALKVFNGDADRGVSRVFADDLAARATHNANSGADRINIRDMARKPEVKAEAPKIEVEPKAEPLKSAAKSKSKNWMDSLADSETYDDFVKRNAKNADLKAHMKETGKTPKEVWRDARIKRGKQNLHRISDEEADRILYDKIPKNEVQGWFNDANSAYKPRILERMAESPDAVNASLNVAYKNYLDSNPKNALPFDEWLDTPQTLYRGTRGQDKTADDIFTAFTPSKESAEKFAGKTGSVEEIRITPRETYGSVMHNLESEFLVPESAVKESATPAPKVEAAKTSKKKKTPPTREERLANSNGVDQYNARAEHQAQRFEEGYEKADNIRAALAGEKPKAPAKGTKPAADNLNAKAKAEAQTNAKKDIDLDEVVNKKREKKTFRERFHELTSSAKTKISDSLNAFEEENKQFIRSDHNKWLKNVGAIDKMRRYNAQAVRSIDNAQVKWNGDTFENGKSLKAIYDGMDEATEKDFDKYLLLKHAPDRAKAGKPIFAGTQYDSAEACEKAAQELLDKHPEFAERAEDLYRYTRNELQNRVDAGLIKQDVVDEWNKKYPYYVPTGRDGDFGDDYDVWDIAGQLRNESNTVGAGKIKAAKGGDQPIRSIKEQLADATSRNWRDMSMNNLFRNMFGDKVGKELAAQADGGVEQVLDNTIGLSKSKGGKYFAEVFIDGDSHRVEIEKRFYDAIEDLYKNGRFGNGIDTAIDAGAKVANPFKNLVTSWNPIFMVKNGLRDFPEAVINSRQTKEFLQVMAQGDALRELKNNGEFLEAFRNSGVSQANFVNLEEALTQGDNWLKKGVNKFATAQEMVETYPRLIEYMATIKKMMPDGYKFKDGLKDVPMDIRDVAAANAADVTVNFGRSGSVGKALNRGVVPFFNPSVQGWSKFLRNVSEQKSTAALLSFSIKAMSLGAGVTAINNLVLEDNPNYQQISARDKATNIILPVTFGKDRDINSTNLFIKIPKSRIAATYSLPMVNVGNENKMGWAEMISVAKDQVAPVDPSESNILSPLLLASKNETWYGTPIVPKALEDLPPSEQYDANTSWFGKSLGKATENMPKELQISPKKADYILDAETGVIGDFALPMATPSKQGSGNAFDKYVKHPAGNVLKRSFTIDSVTQNNLSTRFYDKLNDANSKNQSAKGGKAEADEYKRLNGFSTEVAGINKAIRTLQNGKRATKQEDIYGLQKVRNQYMQDAIDGKAVPSSSKTMDAVQKYVGTTYAINNFGSSTDQKAMKLYGKAKYGELSNSEMRKAINADKSFYKGVRNIGRLEDKMEKAGFKSNTALSKAVALASVGADDDLFGAYRATKQSRTETANKMVRSRNYFKEGGSEGEYVKLEKARKTLGKLTDYDEDTEIEKAEKRLAKGEISLAEYHSKEDEIKYNANRSYVGLATSLAQANAPERGYRLYDIKDKNIQKGINLAAMGITARDFRKMSKDLDSDGNGYPSSKEIRAYVANSDIEDKATLYDALYYYKGTYNPFGTPTKYTRAQAAAAGKRNGVEPIGGDDDNKEFNLKTEASSGSWRGGYYRYGRWHRWGSSGGGSGKGKAMDKSAFKGKNASTAKPTYKSLAANLKTTNRDVRADYDTSSVKYQTAKTAKSAPKTKAVAKKTPPKVKFKKYEV